MATVTWSAKQKSAQIVAVGPKSAGDIRVSATETEDGYLNLTVSSNYGDYQYTREIKEPHIQSLTIHRYSESVEGFNNLFYVCLYYGEKARVNLGSAENPDYLWKYNKVVYSFRPEGVGKKITKNIDKPGVSDCNPGFLI